MRTHNRWIPGIVAVVAVGFATPVLAGAGDSGNWGHHGMMGGAGWFMGPIMMLLWIALIVAAVVLVLRWIGGGPGDSPATRSPGSSARKILEESFARGEVDEEEFRKRKQALEE